MRRISIGRSLRTGALVCLLVTPACLPAMAQPGDSATQARSEQRVYGSDLMTEQEREQYRAQMRSAHTEQERERIRKEHHARMTERARERGVSLPQEPGVGAGPGAGQGPGPGAGPGPGGPGGTGGRGGH